MITLLPTDNIKSRTFGWVQNPSSFRSLCKVVSIFDINSPAHSDMDEVLRILVAPENGRETLRSALNTRPLKISYSHLVGTGSAQRATAPCNAIIQAAVRGQGHKTYIDNWSADGFVRWAHCLGFIKYDYTDDTFEITGAGMQLSAARRNTPLLVGAGDESLNAEEVRLLVEAVLSYPPAIRVLSLLSGENAHLTKFDIGSQLGFIGEGGFTSMPQNIFIRSLAAITDINERKKLRANWEGSSDKYARMIARWLINLGLVEKVEKTVSVQVAGSLFSETIGQAYMITAQGITALNRSSGRSRHARIKKNVCYEMLATKGTSREYLRTRRALTIKILSERRRAAPVEDIISCLEAQNIRATREAVCDDIQGFISIGLEVEITDNGFIWRDSINDFTIPIRPEITQSAIEQRKDELRRRIAYISHDYLSLLDLACDSSQNRQLEIKTLQLLIDECRYAGLHLGGSRKPDGIIYTNTLTDNYGVIIDTKAYPRGYNLPIGQAGEMQRYIQENQRRDEQENPNKWWENFGDNIQRFYFMFVSGYFTGRYQDQIDRISRITETQGAAVKIDNLLLMADNFKGNIINYSDVENNIFHT